MPIRNIVVHELKKEQRAAIQPSNIRPNVLDNENGPVQVLLEGVTDLYGRRNNAAHYGIFRNGAGAGNFPEAFDRYLAFDEPTDNNFLELTQVAMDELFRMAGTEPLATGGYLLFADYTNNQRRFFLVAMVKKKDGLTLSEELEPEELSSLDLSRLNQATRISFDKRTAYLAANEEERKEMNYLSFISSSSGIAASGYFVTAFGCAQGTAASQATDTLIKESGAFFRDHELLNAHRHSFRTDLLGYLAEKEENKESVKLSEVEQLARTYIPAEDNEVADQIVDGFITHLNNEEHAVPVEFPVSKTVLKKHTHIKYDSDNWRLLFDRSVLGDNDNAQIYFNRDNQTLTINQLPQNLITLIENELADQNEEDN